MDDLKAQFWSFISTFRACHRNMFVLDENKQNGM